MALILRPPGTPQSLAERLDSLAHSQRLWSIAAGVATTLAVLGFALFAALGLDSALGLSAALRMVALGAIAALAMALIATRIVRPLRQRDDALRLALHAEDRNPELNDAIASAVAFLENPKSSSAFHTAAIAHAEQLSEPLNWNRLLPLGRFWRGFWLAALAAAALAILALTQASRMPTAVARLIDPWGAHEWPTRTRIELGDYRSRIAVGEPWTIGLTVAGEIPEQARLTLRNANGTIEESVNLATPDEPGVERVRFRSPSASASIALDPSRVPASFEFQVQAGDAATPWRSVSVAPPPRLVPLEGRPSPQIHLDYPAYTGWAALDLPDGGVAVEAVCGTRVTCTAAADRPLAAASLHYQGDTASVALLQFVTPLAIPINSLSPAVLAESFTSDIPVNISGPDRTRLRASFTPPLGGVYVLRFTDDTGLTGQRLLEFRTFADPTPTAALVRPDPASDVCDLLASGSLTVDCRGDDRTFAMRSVKLDYCCPGESWQSKPLCDLRTASEILPALVGGVVPFAATHPPSQGAKSEIAIAKLKHRDGRPPQGGDEITIRTAAADWDDVTLAKEPGCSREVTIRVHSPQSLEATIQKALVGLREPLKKAVEAQTAAAKAATWSESDKSQAELRKLVADPGEGLRAQAARLKKIVNRNALPPSATTARLDAIDKSLARVDEKLLPAIESQMAASKGAKPEALAAQQAAAGRELSDAAAELDRWAGIAELQSDAHALGEQLRKAGAATQKLRDQVPAGVAPDKLPPADRAALDRAASDHAAAAEGLSGLLGKAEKMRDAKAADPAHKEDVDKLEKAVRAAGGSSTAEQLRQSAADVRGNRLSDADSQRAQVEGKLKSLEDALAGRDDSVDELRRKRAATAKMVDELRAEQDALAKKAKAAATPGERAALAEEQERLRRKTDALAEQLAAKNEADAAEKLTRAAEKMEKASEDLAANREGAGAEEAANELAKAQEDLKPKAEAKQGDLEREKQEDLLKSLKAFRERQHAALDESLRLSEAAAKAGRWERPLIASLVALAEREDSLARELRPWTEKTLAEAIVFAKLAGQAADRMEQSAARLRDRKDDALTAGAFVAATEAAADDAVRRPMREALLRLDQIINALSEKPKSQAEKKAAPGEPMPAPMGAGGKPKPPPLAQLKALREWQAEIQNRTTEFANAHPDAAKLTDDDRVALAELQTAQAEITALFEKLRELLKPMKEAP